MYLLNYQQKTTKNGNFEKDSLEDPLHMTSYLVTMATQLHQTWSEVVRRMDEQLVKISSSNLKPCFVDGRLENNKLETTSRVSRI